MAWGMCFSATASLTAGTALVVVGVLTVRTSRGGGLRELRLAVIPLLFGAQQLGEGVVGLSLSGDLGGSPMSRGPREARR